MSVNDCTAFGFTPFEAVSVSWKTPVFFGVPLKTSVERSNVNPDGRRPATLIEGPGVPEAVAVNDP